MKKYRIRKNSIAEWAIIILVGCLFWGSLFCVVIEVY